MTGNHLRTASRSAWIGALAIVLSFSGPVPRADVRAQQPDSGRPRLLVLLATDQFPSEYITLYSHQWTKGLRRLLDEGALFTEGAYPYAGTTTCAGHATIGTGAYPHRHGMIGNQWYDRELDRTVTCEEDPDVDPVVLSEGTTSNRHSAKYIQVPTLADELQRQRPGAVRVVSVAEKARSAIGLGGRGGPDAIVLWKSSGRVWSTSTAFTSRPWDEAVTFLQKRSITDDFGRVWTRLLPESAYLFDDDAPAEPEPAPWTRTFPHIVHSPKGPDDGLFATAWGRSPFADEFVIDFAIHLLKARELGRGDRTDFLAVSLGSLDQAGHQFGPRSHEVQDVLARADVAIGRLLDALDEQVGRGRYTLAWSADHGVARIPEEVEAEGGDAGRLGPLRTLADGLLRWTLGNERYVGLADGAQLSLTPDGLRLVEDRPDVKQLLMSALAASPGVTKVFDRATLESSEPTDDPDLRAWRLSYFPDRSGDFIVVTKRNWIYGARSEIGTNHGSPHDYDRRVPVLLFGAGIRPGKYDTSASPADLAPTLASLAGISLSSAEGRVLTEALVR